MNTNTLFYALILLMPSTMALAMDAQKQASRHIEPDKKLIIALKDGQLNLDLAHARESTTLRNLIEDLESTGERVDQIDLPNIRKESFERLQKLLVYASAMHSPDSIDAASDYAQRYKLKEANHILLGSMQLQIGTCTDSEILELINQSNYLDIPVVLKQALHVWAPRLADVYMKDENLATFVEGGIQQLFRKLGIISDLQGQLTQQLEDQLRRKYPEMIASLMKNIPLEHSVGLSNHTRRTQMEDTLYGSRYKDSYVSGFKIKLDGAQLQIWFQFDRKEMLVHTMGFNNIPPVELAVCDSRDLHIEVVYGHTINNQHIVHIFNYPLKKYQQLDENFKRMSLDQLLFTAAAQKNMITPSVLHSQPHLKTIRALMSLNPYVRESMDIYFKQKSSCSIL